MCLSKYIDVECSTCKISFKKRKDTIKAWKGQCLKCSLVRPKKPRTKKRRLSNPEYYAQKNGFKKCHDCERALASRSVGAMRCRPCWAKSITGIKRPSYIGDKISGAKRHKTSDIKTPEYIIKTKRREGIAWKNAVLERDSHTCQRCSNTGLLATHHIKPKKTYPELSLEVSNGITLCFPCHAKVEKEYRLVHS